MHRLQSHHLETEERHIPPQSSSTGKRPLGPPLQQHSGLFFQPLVLKKSRHNTVCCQGCREAHCSDTAGGAAHPVVRPLLDSLPASPFPCRPAIARLGVQSRETETYVHTQICTQMFTPALFLIAKAGNDPDVHVWCMNRKCGTSRPGHSPQEKGNRHSTAWNPAK